MADPAPDNESQHDTSDIKSEGTESTGVKDAFRAALERKKGRQHPHEGANQGGAKIGEAHRAAGGKREFRRKSG